MIIKINVYNGYFEKIWEKILRKNLSPPFFWLKHTEIILLHFLVVFLCRNCAWNTQHSGGAWYGAIPGRVGLTLGQSTSDPHGNTRQRFWGGSSLSWTRSLVRFWFDPYFLIWIDKENVTFGFTLTLVCVSSVYSVFFQSCVKKKSQVYYMGGNRAPISNITKKCTTLHLSH